MQRLSSTLPVANAGDSKPTYKAFISYSHAADGKLAPTLQSALQTFAKPWYRVRAFSVFRDDTNLSVTPALWPAIETALGKSEFFILLASHEAAASKWVRQEIEFWLTNRSKDKLLIVQTGGEIQWSDSLNDFEWSKTTALPAILSHVFIAISPDGKVVATGGTAVTGSKIYLWDVETRRALGEPLQDHKGPVKALMFSPDGTTLASGAWDYRIVLWDVVTRRPVGLALTGHQGGVETLLYSTDGKRLISSGLDDAVIVWDVDVESWKQRACGVANRNLSCSEWAQFFIDLPYRPACASLGYPPDCSQSQ